jgi:hypothetical protein
MTGWWLPAVAFAAMFCQDIVATIQVQAESAYRPHRSAAMDVLNDACSIATLWAVGDALFVGGNIPLTLVTIAARLVADYAGTWTGVTIGSRIDQRRAAA